MKFQPEFFTYLIGRETDPTLGPQLSWDATLDLARLDTDADFELKRLTMFASIGGAVQTESSRVIPSFNFNILDDATGRTLFNSFADFGALFGDGRSQFILPTSHFFKRGGTARILYNDADFGPDFGVGQVWVGLVGLKHFERTSP